MLKKKKTPMPAPITAKEPTLVERLMAANVATTAATNIFKVAAENLDRASVELDEVAAAAEAEADALLALVEEAGSRAGANRAQAASIRTAMGVN